MSNIKYTDDDKVLDRSGEFYAVGSCYTTPRSLPESVEAYPDKPDPIFQKLWGDVDELTNKPRRFFDHLLSIIEYNRDHDPDIDKGNRREYWAELIEGAEMWLSAVENGLFGEVIKLAEPVPGKHYARLEEQRKEVIEQEAMIDAMNTPAPTKNTETCDTCGGSGNRSSIVNGMTLVSGCTDCHGTGR